MGLVYYGACLDCKEAVDLGKRYRRVYPDEAANPEKWSLEEAADLMTEPEYAQTVLASLLLWNWFISQHQGHRLKVVAETEYYELPDWEWEKADSPDRYFAGVYRLVAE